MVGTVFMEMPLKPNILEDIAKEVGTCFTLASSLLNTRGFFFSLELRLCTYGIFYSIGLQLLLHRKNTFHRMVETKSCSRTSLADCVWQESS